MRPCSFLELVMRIQEALLASKSLPTISFFDSSGFFTLFQDRLDSFKVKESPLSLSLYIISLGRTRRVKKLPEEILASSPFTYPGTC